MILQSTSLTATPAVPDKPGFPLLAKLGVGAALTIAVAVLAMLLSLLGRT